ncbi:uncharacterized protein PV07_08686 [Cladophialophora immunda]|uniref:ABC-2 type transporter transmembrane domain-containing protein n=1 Tax=Cladophialophora immunda TaxID=569365 RepID=A0A0D2C517_9EURO|nr:uncharacterized protein PV07_08686 [Cladophialophora immunda]KIW25520.1 hypothetical protein PV07_08686 [Cladophialophora immunda]
MVESPNAISLGILVFAPFDYPTFGITSSKRQELVLLFCIQFFVFGSTFAHMVVAALPDAETAGQIATMLFYLALTLNGVLLPPKALPGFWIFAYRVSPLTYLVNGVAIPAPNMTCGEYMVPYLQAAGPSAGTLIHPEASRDCEYCPLQLTDQFLTARNAHAEDDWQDFGIVWAFIGFNVHFSRSLLPWRTREPLRSFRGSPTRVTGKETFAAIVKLCRSRYITQQGGMD